MESGVINTDQKQSTIETKTNSSQYAEWILNKIAKATKETFTWLKWIFQGFRIYFVWNSSFKGIESTILAA